MKRLAFLSLLTVLSIGLWAQVNDLFITDSNKLQIENYTIYSKLHYEKALISDEKGKPALPFIIKIYLLPPNSKITDLQVTMTQQTALDGDYLVLPAQPPQMNEQSTETTDFFVLPDTTIYNSGKMYPEIPYELLSEEEIFGYRVCKLKIYPVSYLPVEKKLYINNLNICINTDQRLASSSQPIPSERRKEMARNYILSLVDNPEDLINLYPTTLPQDKILRTEKAIPTIGKPDCIPDYLIITSKALKSEFQRLADWKTKKGIVTYLKTIEEINTSYKGIDLQERIRNYIIESTNKWGNTLFILLGGDVNSIPIREHLTENTRDYGRQFFAADSYYANIDPNNTWNANHDNFLETHRIM